MKEFGRKVYSRKPEERAFKSLLCTVGVVSLDVCVQSMAIPVLEFLREGYKVRLGRFLPKNQRTQRKLLNFEF